VKRYILAAEKRGGETSRLNLVLVIVGGILPTVKTQLVLIQDERSEINLPHSLLVFCRTLDWKKFLTVADSHHSAGPLNIRKVERARSKILSELSCTVWATI
jgi:hypothetical protein